jgi:alanyl-tRNA synthetase
MPIRKLSGSEVRSMFLRYFEQHGHKIVRSSSLVPANDPTLLFTNAGMNQFKDVFLGIEKRDYSRATSSQKCVRAGGKHNDLENVGFTNRHHTFFEMLGNFSFGDYFKKDAIAFAWELVTSPEWFGIDKNKLYVTIFKGATYPDPELPRDDEAEEAWLDVGVPMERIFELGMKDNFWQMGDTGPCGPCSELHYDMGPAASELGHTDCTFPCDCGRYVEIWNLVFMQYNFEAGPRGAYGVPGSELRLLPRPSIDTGAGLERVTAVMQGVISNYDTDLFTPLILRAAELMEKTVLANLAETVRTQGTIAHASSLAKAQVSGSLRRLVGTASLRIIADHSRAATFLINDGVLPSNESRGYVLRKIIRRAIRHGRLLGQNKPFLFEMVFAVRDLMKDAYPELVESADRVAEMIKGEETRFAHTLDIGLTRLDDEIAEQKSKSPHYLEYYSKFFPEDPSLAVSVFNIVKPLIDKGALSDLPRMDRIQLVGEFTRKLGMATVENRFFELVDFLDDLGDAQLEGAPAFKLYDTFGLPRDFIEDACRDAGVQFDAAGFDAAMEEQRKRAQASWKGGSKASASPAYQALPPTVFEGYRKTLSTGCEVLAIIKPHDGTGVGAQELKPGERGEIVLDHTPFYADAGGQVGDVGWLYGEDHNTIVAEVEGATYPVQGVRAHRVIAKQPIHVGDKVDAMVNDEVRRATMRNHTGTHLLHAALREVLGKHVKQAGSLVDPAHLRFDFSHFASLDDEELQDIEDLANREVLRNDRVEVIEDVPIDVAVNEYHAMALFGEKYGDRVRVIRIGDFSTELCGGTHTSATGEIGLIKVLKEGSVSSGVRRLEAITGEGSLRHFRKDHQLENVVSTLVRGGDAQSPADALKQELERREEELKKLRKELEQARMKSASSSVQSAAENVREVKGVKVLATRADNLERSQLRVLIDNLRNKLGSGVVVLGSVSDGKVALIVGVTKDLTSRVQAGKIIAEVAKKVGGSGGGRPDMAEAGGKDPAALDSALAESYGVVERLLP